jgi:hypothetical protein
MEQAPVIMSGQATGSSLAASNVLGQYYANPQYQGRAGSNGITDPGGFGSPLYTSTGGGFGGTGYGGRTGGAGLRGTTGTVGGGGGTRSALGSTGSGFGNTAAGLGAAATGGRTTGATGFGNTGTGGGRTGATGFGGQGFGGQGFGGGGIAGLGGAGLGGFGGTQRGMGGFGNTGLGGFGGTQRGLGGQATGEIIPPQRAIAYTATIRLPTPVVAPTQMQADLRTVIDRSSLLSNPRGINVGVEGNGVVVLRGNVRDEEEAKTAEGMIRLTPGVRQVRNELKYPVQ